VKLTGEAGKTAPSFIATIAVVALLAVGYVAWLILRPNPIAESEMVVRDFSSAAAAEIGPLRRALREEVARYAADPSTLVPVQVAIDKHAADARETIEALAEDARDRIELIDGIGLRTQENRLQRIQSRKADAQARINSLVADAKSRLPARAEP
jgi:hypothetical protein